MKPRTPTPMFRARVTKPKTIVVKARNGNREIPTTHINEETRWIYKNGQCFSLAIILAEEKGTDVGLLVQCWELPWGTNYDDPNLTLDIDHDWFSSTIHAIALTEDSIEDETLTIDIDGERDMGGVREEFQEGPQSGTMIRIKPADLRYLLSSSRRGTGFYKPDYDSAKLIAPLIPRD